MNQNMFAALLFAMLSGMHPEETAPEDSKPQNTHACAESEKEPAAAPVSS